MKAEKKDFKPIIIYIVLNYFVVSFIVGFILGLMYGDIVGDEQAFFNNITIISSLIGNFICFSIFAVLYRKRLKDDFKRLTKRDLLKILITFFAIIILTTILTEILIYFNVPFKNQDLLSSEMISGNLLISLSTVFLAVILAPVVEEFVFRYSIGTIIKNKYWFIIISGLVFSIFHGIGLAMIVYWIMGSLLALVYYSTNKNIWSSIIAHFINNFLSVIIIFL